VRDKASLRFADSAPRSDAGESSATEANHGLYIRADALLLVKSGLRTVAFHYTGAFTGDALAGVDCSMLDAGYPVKA